MVAASIELALRLQAPLVRQRLIEFRRVGEPAFLSKYEVNRAKTTFISYQVRLYPLKAIASAATGVPPRFHTDTAERLLGALGFDVVRPPKPNEGAEAASENIQPAAEAWRLIRQRRGQPKFRNRLMKAYRRTCAVTRC